MHRHRLVSAISLIVLVSLLLVAVPTRPATARFVLASWDYPDEYGQGIDEFRIWQYIDGSWESLTPFGWVYSASGATLELTENASLVIEARCWLNNTMVGAASLEDGKNFLTHSIVVSVLGRGTLFSQQNFTYHNGFDTYDPMYRYYYNVTVDCSIIGGLTYRAVIDFDIWM